VIFGGAGLAVSVAEVCVQESELDMAMDTAMLGVLVTVVVMIV
jgi:hypothetical protein